MLMLPWRADTKIAVFRIAQLRLVVDFLRPNTLSAPGRIEARADRFDHLAKPVDVQAVEDEVGAQGDAREPKRDITILVECSDLATRISTDGQHLLHTHGGSGSFQTYTTVVVHVTVLIEVVEIAEDDDGVPDAPDETAAEEDEDEAGAVDGLVDGAGEVEFVAEPVDVEEGAAEFVEEEDGGGEVDVWPLSEISYHISDHLIPCL